MFTKGMGYLAKDVNVQVKLMKGFLIESNVYELFQWYLKFKVYYHDYIIWML